MAVSNTDLRTARLLNANVLLSGLLPPGVRNCIIATSTLRSGDTKLRFFIFTQGSSHIQTLHVERTKENRSF